MNNQQVGKAAMSMTSNIYMNSTTKFIGLNSIDPNLKNIDELKQRALGGFLNVNQKTKKQQPNNKEGGTTRIATTKLSQLGSSALFQGLDSPPNRNRVLSGNKNSFTRVQQQKPQTSNEKNAEQKSKPQHIQRSHGRNIIKNDSSQVSSTRYRGNISKDSNTDNKNIVVEQFQKNHTQMKDDFSLKQNAPKNQGGQTDRSQPSQSKKSDGFIYKPLGGAKKEVSQSDPVTQQKKVQLIKPVYGQKNISVQPQKVQQKNQDPVGKSKKLQTNILKKELSPLNIQNNKPLIPSKKSPQTKNEQSSNQSGYVYRPPKKVEQKSFVFQQQAEKKNIPNTNIAPKKIQRKVQDTTATKQEPIKMGIITSPKNNESNNKLQRKPNQNLSQEQGPIYLKNRSNIKHNRVKQQMNLQLNTDTNYFKLEIKGGSTQRSRQKSLTDRSKSNQGAKNQVKVSQLQNNNVKNANGVNVKSNINVNANSSIAANNLDVKSAYQYKKPLVNRQSPDQISNSASTNNNNANTVINTKTTTGYQYTKPVVSQIQVKQAQQKPVLANQNQTKHPPSRLSKQPQQKPLQQVVVTSNVNKNVSLISPADNNVNTNANSKNIGENAKPGYQYKKPIVNTVVEQVKQQAIIQPGQIKRPSYSYGNRPKTKEELLQGMTPVGKPETTKSQPQANNQKLNKIKTPQKNTINPVNNASKTLISYTNDNKTNNVSIVQQKNYSNIKPMTKEQLLKANTLPTNPINNIAEQKKNSPSSKMNNITSSNNQSGYVYRPPKKSQKFIKPANDQSTTVNESIQQSAFKKNQQSKIVSQQVPSTIKTSNIEVRKPTYKYGQKHNLVQQPNAQTKIQQVKTTSQKKQQSKPIKPSYERKQVTSPTKIANKVNVMETKSKQLIQSPQVQKSGNVIKAATTQVIAKQKEDSPKNAVLKRPNPILFKLKMIYQNHIKKAFEKIHKKSQQVKTKKTKITSVFITQILSFSKKYQRNILNTAMNQLKKKVLSQFNKQVQAKKHDEICRLKFKSQQVLSTLIEKLFKNKLKNVLDSLNRNKVWKKSIEISCQSLHSITSKKQQEIQSLAFKKLRLYNLIVKSNVEDVLNIFKTSNGKNLKDTLHKLFSTAFPVKNLKAMTKFGSQRSISTSRVSIVNTPIKGNLSNSPSQRSLTSQSIKGVLVKNTVKQKIQKLQKQISQKASTHQRQIKQLSVRKQGVRKEIKKSNSEVKQKKDQNSQLKKQFQKSQGKQFGQVQDALNNGKYERLEYLSNMYTNLFKFQANEIDLSEIKENIPINDMLDENANIVIKEWEEIRKNVTLKNEINKYQGVQPKQYKATKNLLQEQDIAQKLLRSYVRERYLWQWVRKTASSIVY